MMTATEVRLRQAEWTTRNAPKLIKLAVSLEPLHRMMVDLLAREAGRIKAEQSDRQ